MTRIAQLEPTRVTVGVDTHRDAHVAVALDQLVRRLGQLEIATTRAGYAQLLAWAESFGEVVVFAVEGCGCYGAGLARHLGAQHVRVVEVMRANRQTRRRKGKSDPTDAEAAGRAVLAGEAAAAPKSGDDVVEMIRVLRVVRVTAMKATHSGHKRAPLAARHRTTRSCATNCELSRASSWCAALPASARSARQPPGCDQAHPQTARLPLPGT